MNITRSEERGDFSLYVIRNQKNKWPHNKESYTIHCGSYYMESLQFKSSFKCSLSLYFKCLLLACSVVLYNICQSYTHTFTSCLSVPYSDGGITIIIIL